MFFGPICPFLWNSSTFQITFNTPNHQFLFFIGLRFLHLSNSCTSWLTGTFDFILIYSFYLNDLALDSIFSSIFVSQLRGCPDDANNIQEDLVMNLTQKQCSWQKAT